MGKKGKTRDHDDPQVGLSKALSWLLRHAAAEQGVPIRPDGFCKVSDILSLQRFRKWNIEDVNCVVLNNAKQRFTLTEEDGIAYIRANQGHTMCEVDEERLLDVVKSPEEIPTCVHGTYRKFWDAIRTEGLCRMQRNHIHFMPGEPRSGEVISGMRSNCDILVYVDVAKAMAAGVRFYRSDNNVILTPGLTERGLLAPEYFLKVVDNNNGDTIFKNKEEIESSESNVSSVSRICQRLPHSSIEQDTRSDVFSSSPSCAKLKGAVLDQSSNCVGVKAAGAVSTAEGTRVIGARGASTSSGTRAKDAGGSWSSRMDGTKDAGATRLADDASQACSSVGTSTFEQEKTVFAVIDFEATCDDQKKIYPQEIIEFPIVFLDASGQPLRDAQGEPLEQSVFVRPTRQPTLSMFCTKLTSIRQHDVDEADTLPQVLEATDRFITQLLHKRGSTTDDIVFVTCGDWDLRTMLPKQCQFESIKYPKYFRRWINVKKPFETLYTQKAGGMENMLKKLNLKLEGTHHRGIDDSRNIAKLLRKLIQDGYHTSKLLQCIQAI
ncbi:hypothetical protein CYMTET_11495 [Cymbomonas tetramitiformis]|uniref:2'-phosphotransferase n=1 Tax=Cymbomonas tetramitiformis TaxID=36881 RepID=A0AAE0GLZ7_9CHLO|nr:hypothetical protein CYMTET_11495 [Cymbomonas tetramitiformis]|eukprot:gene14958-17680_t